MTNDHPLTILLIRVTPRPRADWPTLTDAATVAHAMEAAQHDKRELRSLQACFPDPVLRAHRLRRFARAFAVPEAVVDKLLAEVEALPRPPLPDPLELSDWAWKRRRELFGR